MKTNRPLLVIQMGAYTPHAVKTFEEINVEVTVVSPFHVGNELQTQPLGIVLCGGGTHPEGFLIPSEVLTSDIPILSIGSNSLVLAMHLGAAIRRAKEDEVGQLSIHVDNTDPLFDDMDTVQSVFSSLRFVIEATPPGMRHISTFRSGALAGFSHTQRLMWGIAFNPTSNFTSNGLKILRNFVTLCRRRVEPAPEPVVAME